MSYNHTFHWPKGPEEVIVTGTFDSWAGSLPLVKTSKGDFEITLPVKEEKIEFKFIVDGHWTVNKEYETVSDNGNENNVLYLKNLEKATGEAEKETGSEGSKEAKGSSIPESGGLVSAAAGLLGLGGAGAAAATAGSSSKKDETSVPEGEKEVKTTVLPSNEGKHATVKGEPGVAIPSDPHQVKEFSEVRDVDAKELNAKLNKEEESKTADVVNDENKDTLKSTVLPSTEGQHATVKGEPGVAIPANAQDIKEFSEVRDVDAKDLNAKLNKEDEETDAAVEDKKTKTVKVKKLIRRNKQTGEETVVSSEPVTEEDSNGKTLDPKAGSTPAATTTSTTSNGVKKDTAAAAAAPATTTTKDTKTTPSTTKDPKKTTSKTTTPATAAATEEKKKSSIFKKVKKFFD